MGRIDEWKRASGGRMTRMAAPLMRRALLLCCALAVGFAVALAPAAASRASGAQGLKLLGRLPEPPGWKRSSSCSIVQLDAAARRMYYLCWDQSRSQAQLTAYDLSQKLPRPVQTANALPTGQVPSSISPYTTALDHRRHRLLLLASGVVGSEIYLFDLRSLRKVGVWDLSQSLPGFAVAGLTYAPQDDRLYLIGDEYGSTAISASMSGIGTKALAPGTSVVALDPRTGRPLWIRPVPQCQQVMMSFTAGALIARSDRQPALYFFCSTGGTIDFNPFPGEAGLVRLGVSKTTSENTALKLPIEFFPVSGSYSAGNAHTGIAAFDPGTDRFFVQSLAAATPGTWVFDGTLSAWVGFITAPNADDHYLGLDTSTGHFYMGGDGSTHPGWLLVADARITPVPQGTTYPYTPQLFIPVDPRTHRLFVSMDLSAIGGKKGQVGYVVLQDDTPQSRPLQPINYDAQTSNVPEGPRTITTFAGDIDGYGVRMALVGGLGGAVSDFHDVISGISTGLNLGDRGLMGARVSSVDLREVGASATAQSAESDTATDSDRGGIQQQLQTHGAQQAAALLNWPWVPATCLDSGGRTPPQRQSGPGGTAEVRCDLSKGTAQASASFGGFRASDQGVKVSVASASFSTNVMRDQSSGAVTRSTAIANGIDVAVPHAGELTIAKVVSVGETRAHGRPDTTGAGWARLLEGVVVRDAKGKVVASYDRCATDSRPGRRSHTRPDDCTTMQRTINDTFGTRVRFDLPSPQIIATPRGAFAGIQQSDAAYLQGQTVYGQGTAFHDESLGQRAVPAVQIAVFNDSSGQSRLLLQLAAIQASSIYTISLPTYGGPPLPTTPSVGGTSVRVPVSTGSGGGVASGPVRPGPAPIGPTSTTTARTSSGGSIVGVLIRTPKEALLTAGMWVLFILAAVAVVRRRNLLDVLGGGGK
jgi:hypothetical protein